MLGYPWKTRAREHLLPGALIYCVCYTVSMENFSFNSHKEQKEKTPPVRDGVSFVFEQHPELADIGTMEQYSQYLDTIFPESKVKDVVYHGTNEKFDKFDKSKIGSSVDKIVKTKLGNPFNGFYFAPTQNWINESSKIYGEWKNKISVILNIKKPYKNLTFQLEKQLGYSSNMQHGVVSPIKRENDGLLLFNDDGTNQQIIVFEPEQIHILGSQSDIEKFKNYVALLDHNNL